MKRSHSIEFLIITVIGLIYFALHAPPLPKQDYSSPLLDLRPIANLLVDNSVRTTGLEHERLVGAILPLQVGLQRYGHVPFWNSYLSSGVPLINNGFNYLFNPFESLPVFIWGGVTGSKIATIIALIIAGYSMWAFGLALGLGAVARVTIALLYMLNGSIAAKFGQGHFQLACSLAWPPLVLATLWWTLHSSKRRAPIAVGMSFALLFYAGNIYYTLHTTLCCIVIVALHLVERRQGRWHLRYDRFRRVLVAGLFAFGLSALQFFPLWQVRDYVTHGQQIINPDGTLANNYDLLQALNNLIQPWQQWQPNYFQTLIQSVDYAYIGIMVFILILLAASLGVFEHFFRKDLKTNFRKYRTAICAALLLGILMMLWSGGQIQPVPWLYAHVPLLDQFRYLGRALAIADLWWIVLAGIALDVIWNRLREYTTVASLFRSTSRIWLVGSYIAVILIWLFMFIYSASAAPNRIAMVMRNVNWWQQLDPLRYTSLFEALQAVISLLVAATLLNTVIIGAQHLWRLIRHKQNFPLASLAAYVAQIVLLVGIVSGVLDVMIANTPAFRFEAGVVPTDAVYADIRRMDKTNPFPSVGEDHSHYIFGAYEQEIRIWSLNEGWLPSAPEPTLKIPLVSNLPRWYIAKRNTDGSLYDNRAQRYVETKDYVLRKCYFAADNIWLADSCSLRQVGLNLYELPQALPYAFMVSDPILTNNVTNLNADQVQAANVLLYQQDNIIIHTNASWTDSDKHYLVLQEANFPGWQITRDGEPVQPVTVPTAHIGQQTLGLIAVPLEAGDHSYAFRFEPPGLSTGILVFCGTLVLILVYLKVTYKQKSPA